MTTTSQEANWTMWMRAAVAGDSGAYRKFLHAVAPYIRAIARSRCRRLGILESEAEDIVQEVLLTIHLKQGTWDRSREIGPWLTAITRNKIIDVFRRRGRRIEVPIDDVMDSLQAEEELVDLRPRDIDALVGKLTCQQQEIVRSISIGGASIRETAERLDMTEVAVRVSLHRALKALGVLCRSSSGETDELINILSNDGPPRKRLESNLALGAVVGTLVAATLFFAVIGFRLDIAQAVQTIRFLFKFVVTISLAATAILVTFKLSRPDEDFRSSSALLLAPMLLACAVGIELLVLPSGQWTSKLIGHNARICLTLIPLLSIGPLICFMAALRHGAPSNPGWTGATAGLAASGIAATFYASNCNDDSPLFVATWYPIAILAVSAAGYLIGRRALKW